MNIAEEFAAIMGGAGNYRATVWFAVTLCLAAIGAPAVRLPPRLRQSRTARILSHPSLFLFVLGLTLFLFRWPTLYFPDFFNPDEAQALTEAITLTHDPVFPRVLMWAPRFFQPYLLAIPSLFGFDLTYASSRFISLALYWVTCVALYYTVRTVSGETAARITSSAAILCFAMGVTRDFLSHATDLNPIAPLAVSLFLFYRLPHIGEHRQRSNALLLGLVLGAVPFAKHQGSPIALTIAALAYVWILLLDRRILRQRVRTAAALTAGGLIIPGAIVLLYALCGKLGEYATLMSSNPAAQRASGPPFLVIVRTYLGWTSEREWSFEWLLFGSSAFSLAMILAWAVRRSHWKSRPWWELFSAVAVLAASWFSLFAPARAFTHYTLYTIIPLCLLSGVLLAGAVPALTPRPERLTFFYRLRTFPWRYPLAVACLLLPLVVLMVTPLYHRWDHKEIMAQAPLQLLLHPNKPASNLINEYKKPGDALTVWGWAPEYNVETQLPIGMRVTMSHLLLEERPLRDLFRERNLAFFKQRKPAFFIDAVCRDAFFFDDREKFGHEVFPELAAHVRAHYRQVAEFDGVRVYFRNERIQEIRAARAAGK